MPVVQSDIPPAFGAIWSTATVKAIGKGQSGDRVFDVQGSRGEDFYVKLAKTARVEGLPAD